jgi:hypothetical protein
MNSKPLPKKKSPQITIYTSLNNVHTLETHVNVIFWLEN